MPKPVHTMTAPAPASDKLLRLPEVSAKVGLGRSAIYERIARGEFPQSVPLGGRLAAWSMNEIDAWIESRKAARPVAA